MDFTEALVPRHPETDRHGALERLARDAEQLAVIQRIVDGWTERIQVSATRSVSRDVVISAAMRSAVEHSICRQLVDDVLRDHGPGALTFNVHTSWRPEGAGRLPRGQGLTAQQLDAYRPESAIVDAHAIVIPGGQGGDDTKGSD